MNYLVAGANNNSMRMPVPTHMYHQVDVQVRKVSLNMPHTQLGSESVRSNSFDIQTSG